MLEINVWSMYERISLDLLFTGIRELGVLHPEMPQIVDHCRRFSRTTAQWLDAAYDVGAELVVHQYYGGPWSSVYAETERAYARWMARLLPDQSARRLFMGRLYRHA